MSKDSMALALVAIFGNPINWIIIALISIAVCAAITESKETEAKEKTKQVAMQLEIARLQAGITNKVEIPK